MTPPDPVTALAERLYQCLGGTCSEVSRETCRDLAREALSFAREQANAWWDDDEQARPNICDLHARLGE